MKHLSQIDLFVEGRKAPSPEERKRLYQQKEKQNQEQKAQQLREIQLMEGLVLLPDTDETSYV